MAQPDDRRRDNGIDEALEETFPASDAPANTVETGVATGPISSAEPTVTDNRERHQFELTVDGHHAVLAYQRDARSLTLVHTEVAPELRGRHLGERLVEAARQAAASEGLRLVPQCPFAAAYLRKHPNPA